MPSFPVRIGKKPFQVTIYEPTAKESRFKVYWRQNGRNRQKGFKVYQEAEIHAKSILDQLKAGSLPPVSLSRQQTEQFIKADQICREMGWKVLDAVQDWSTAKKTLCDGSTLSAAVEQYNKSKTSIKSIAVEDAVKRYLKWKSSFDLAPKYLRTIKSAMTRFSNSFNGSMGTLDFHSLSEWFLAGPLATKTKNQHGSIVNEFLKWSVNQGFLRDDTKLVKAFRKQKAPVTVESFYTPEQLRRILEHSPAHLRFRIYLVAFCGLRTEEAIEWNRKDDLTAANSISVSTIDAKTKKRRIAHTHAPICRLIEQNAPEFEMNQPYYKGESRYQYHFQKAKRDAGVSNQKNGLRHSFISYREAIVQDTAKVANESGTSPEEVYTHYRELVSENAAKEWFEIQLF